ncbi:MAG: O-antigen/teichoic acid export membrane protein [Psychroserpens sp.]|jgi:O-antigen/teichoic acid export membrane protein
MTAKKSVRSAILASSIGQYLVFSMAFISVVTYSRLLSPSEIGVFAIASSLAMLAREIQLLGTASYLIRQKHISKKDVQSGIGLTMLICWSLGAIFFIIANPISSYYEIPGLSGVIKILSLSFLVAPFISVTSALLIRKFQFQKILQVTITARIAEFSLGITLVYLGYSFYAMAIGVVCGTFIEFSLLYRFRTQETSWRPRFTNILPIVKFGLLTSSTNLMRRFGTTAPDIIIGKLGTPTEVAIFSRGLGFLDFAKNAMCQGLQPIALPFLAQKNRENGNINEGYLTATVLMGAVVWPVLTVCGIASYPIIVFVFGQQWANVAPIAGILSVWAIFTSVHLFSPALLIASFNEKIQFFKQLIIFILTVTGILLTYEYGLKAVALSLVFNAFIDMILITLIIKLATKLPIIEFVKRIMGNVILCFSCGFTTWLIGYKLNFLSTEPIISLLCVGAVAVSVWVVTIVLLKHPLLDELKKLLNSTKMDVK